MADRSMRLKAGFALAKALGSAETRRMFEDRNYSSEEIVLTLESDTIQEVFARIQNYDPPVVVAIYWPDTERLRFTQMEPGAAPKDYVPGEDDVGGASTIGMLWEHAERQANATFLFRLQWGVSPSINLVPFEVAGAR